MFGTDLYWGPTMFGDLDRAMRFRDEDDDGCCFEAPWQCGSGTGVRFEPGFAKQGSHPTRGSKVMKQVEVAPPTSPACMTDAGVLDVADRSETRKAWAREVIAAFVLGAVVRRSGAMDRLRKVAAVRERVNELERKHPVLQDLSEKVLLVLGENLINELLKLDCIDSRYIRPQRKSVAKHIDSLLEQVEAAKAQRIRESVQFGAEVFPVPDSEVSIESDNPPPVVECRSGKEETPEMRDNMSSHSARFFRSQTSDQTAETQSARVDATAPPSEHVGHFEIRGPSEQFERWTTKPPVQHSHACKKLRSHADANQRESLKAARFAEPGCQRHSHEAELAREREKLARKIRSRMTPFAEVYLSPYQHCASPWNQSRYLYMPCF